jgi:DNA (cytosine-5)-methyltransferase 1
MGKPTFGSLFAGIGGLDLGLERAGFECKWQVEIDPYARRVLTKHWPDVPKFEDVREFPPIGEFSVDVICGGFPCQDISYAGKGAGLDGERSGLFYELIRVVSLVGPKFVLLENVSALLTRGLDQVLGTLASIGYDAEWHCIPAAAFGSPHMRDRVFVLGVNTNGEYVSSVRISQGFEPPSNAGGIERQMVSESRAQDAYRRWAKSTKSDWWTQQNESAICRVAYGVPSRMDRLRGLGNAVVPQVAEYIGRQIIQLTQ